MCSFGPENIQQETVHRPGLTTPLTHRLESLSAKREPRNPPPNVPSKPVLTRINPKAELSRFIIPLRSLAQRSLFSWENACKQFRGWESPSSPLGCLAYSDCESLRYGYGRALPQGLPKILKLRDRLLNLASLAFGLLNKLRWRVRHELLVVEISLDADECLLKLLDAS